MQNSILVLLEGSWIVSLFFFLLVFKDLSIWKTELQRAREGEIFYPSLPRSQQSGWAWLTSGAWNPTWFSHMSDYGWAILAIFLRHSRRELDWKQNSCASNRYLHGHKHLRGGSPRCTPRLVHSQSSFLGLFFVCLFVWLIFFSFYFYQVAEFELLKWSARLYFLTW